MCFRLSFFFLYFAFAHTGVRMMKNDVSLRRIQSMHRATAHIAWSLVTSGPNAARTECSGVRIAKMAIEESTSHTTGARSRYRVAAASSNR